MLQAHSFLWNYLWVAPNVFLLILGFFIWKRGLSRQLPAFLVFVIFSAVGDLAVFAADIVRSVSAVNFWRVDWAYLLIESFLKFLVIGEVFSRVLSPYSSISRLGRILVSGFGAALVLLATLAAAYSRGDSSVRLISGFHLLEQTVFLVELGLVVFIFLFAAYFRLSWNRLSFGVLLGFGVSACGHLAGWAISANADLSAYGRTLLDFLDMTTHHICVLIWFYYLLVPGKVAAKTPAPLPENNLDLWNRELERLLQQ
ncbi:MAG TPA: hypothetical protein VFO46_21975 [Candidatus Sulfotelmatobacter sp.]|nr:hypothetical protein [Candidatus Sulfotelmatobacter sp.]